MKRTKYIIFFLIINFSGLVLGTLLMKNGPLTDWYIDLNKAPWTPPGWFFGVAWTMIMICFSIYLGHLFMEMNTKKMQFQFFIQFVLNVIWNYVFFNQHLIGLGLINLIFLTLLIFYYFFEYKNVLKTTSYLLLPYMLWLIIAITLNAYILLNN